MSTIKSVIRMPWFRVAGQRVRAWVPAWVSRILVTGLGILLIAWLGVVGSTSAEVGAAKEHDLKALFIYNFVKFADWPAERMPASGAPLIVGIVGKGPIQQALEAAIKDRLVHGRELIVRQVETLSAAKEVHVLFVLGSEDKKLDVLLPELAGSGVLTVGETEYFSSLGGMICFKVLEDKIRFEINMESVERDRLKLSAQLQKLATAVRRKS